MKKVLIAVLVVATAFVSCKENKKDKVTVKEEVKTEVTSEKLNNIRIFNVDAANSVLRWKGFKPTGSHEGTVDIFRGKVIFNGNDLKNGKFEIDMKSIKNTDMLGSGGDNIKLETHLKSEDFFDVKNFPLSRFRITSVEKRVDGITVSGDLVIKDVAKNITFKAIVEENENFVLFRSETFKIDRSDFDIKYKSKSFFNNLKDKFINDLIEISFEISLKK